MTTLIVTGASGYIGEAVLSKARAQGLNIIALARHDIFGDATQFVPYNLERDNDLSALPAGAPIIHLAVDVERPEINRSATARLSEWAQQHCSRLVFVSSQTARMDAPTPYGRSKASIEIMLQVVENSFIVRPGMVYGGMASGLYGQICALIARMPLLPAFVPGPRIQPIHVDELAAALIRLAIMPAPARKVFCLGSMQPVSFTNFVQDIADTMKVRRYYLPVPSVFITPVLKLEPYFPARLQTALASLRSLFDLPVMETQASLDALEISLRPMGHAVRRAAKLKEISHRQQDPQFNSQFHDHNTVARLRSFAALPLSLVREACLFITGRR